MQRVGAEKDRMESAGKEFFNRVRQGYLKLAKLEPQRIKVVDSTKSIDEVQIQVQKLLKNISSQTILRQGRNSEHHHLISSEYIRFWCSV